MKPTRHSVIVNGSVRTLWHLDARSSVVFAVLHRNDPTPHPDLELRVAASDLERSPERVALLPWSGEHPAPLVALHTLSPREVEAWLLKVDWAVEVAGEAGTWVPLCWTLPVTGQPLYASTPYGLAPVVRDHSERMVGRHLREHYRTRT